MAEPTVEERALPLFVTALLSHGYRDSEGNSFYDKIEDVIFDTVVKAVVHKLADRKALCVTRTSLTRTVVPNMTGPGDFAETDDPEASEKAWSMVNELVWRMCDSNSGGRVQDRLNGEHALVLCRTKATNERGVWGVYVTRDWKCLVEDFIKPDQQAVARALARQTKNAVLGVGRLPEHGKKFRTELNAETKNVLNTGVSKIDRMIEAADNNDSSEDDE